MDRRQFIKTSLAAAASLAIPSSALALSRRHPFQNSSVQHLARYDDREDYLVALQQAFGECWYGSVRPVYIVLPSKLYEEIYRELWPRRIFMSTKVKTEHFLFIGSPVYRALNENMSHVYLHGDDSYKDRRLSGWYFAHPKFA